MRLIIQRDQAIDTDRKGRTKSVAFTLRVRLELTENESAIVGRYKLGDYPVTYRTVQGTQIPDDTIDMLVSGTSQTVSSVKTLISNENVLKAACDSLPPLFEVVATFGGSEVIDYPRTSGG